MHQGSTLFNMFQGNAHKICPWPNKRKETWQWTSRMRLYFVQEQAQSIHIFVKAYKTKTTEEKQKRQ